MNQSRNAILGFAMVFAILVVNAALAYLNVYQLRETYVRVKHTHQVLLALETLLAQVIDAETGQRGYMITHVPSYLEPYQSARQSLNRQFETLEKLTLDDPVQTANLGELKEQVRWRMDLLEEAIRRRQEGGLDEARDVILRGEGKIAMDGVRAIVRRMETAEEAQLAQRDREALTSYRTAVVTGLIAALMGVTLAGIAYALVQRDIVNQAQTAAELQEAKDLLEDRVRERTAAISDANDSLRREVEDRRKAEEQAFQFALELQRSNRELEQFASVASHDLQEPLRKIQAFGDRLQTHAREKLDAKGAEYLDRMLASAGRMRALIDGLLAYSRVARSGQAFSSVSLQQVADDVLSDLEGRIQSSGGKVEVGPLPTIVADAMQMRQLFQNLIGNALKFRRPEVPPLVKVSAATLVSAGNGEGPPATPTYQIAVEDNGIGFEPEYAGRIFEMFQRLHGRGEFEGTGMGLAICRKIVERHGGTISATSTPHQGSRFVVTLPAEPVLPGEEAGEEA
jgi:signal transduction histidine kinase